jgi:hypothetical protein
LRSQSIEDAGVWTALRHALDAMTADGRGGGRWQLRTAAGSAAQLTHGFDAAASVRVDIRVPPATGAAFDIQLNLPRLTIWKDRLYAIRFEARADAPRTALIGVARAHAPWTGLGWHQHLQLTPAWQGFEGRFQPSDDERDARIHVDVGESLVPVEIRSVGLFEIPDDTPVEPGDPTQSTSDLLGGLRRLAPISRQWGFDRGLPIDRYYIEAFLDRQATDIRGRVLEVEDNVYTRRFGGDRVTTSDVLHVTRGNPRATLVADLAYAPHLSSDVFDAIILTQTLHLIFDTRAALQTLHRILKPGGVLLATFPGLSKVSRDEWSDSWFWAFTTASAQRLFAEVFGAEQIHVATFGNVLSAVAFLHGLAAEELHQEELDHGDPEYQLLIAVRGVKTAGQA